MMFNHGLWYIRPGVESAHLTWVDGVERGPARWSAMS